MRLAPARRAANLQLAKLNFQKETKNSLESKKARIASLWRTQLDNVARIKDEIDSRYDAIMTHLDASLGTLSNKLATARNEVIALRANVDRQKQIKARLQIKTDENQLEISAEIDLELKLQQHAADLQVQLGDSRRRLERQLEKKAQLKKSYIRLIAQYKKLKAEEEDREHHDKALHKRAALLKRKQELEEEQRRAKESENDPRNKYKALLAAAGHIDACGAEAKPADSLTFYQGPLMQTDAPPRPDQILVDSPQYDEGIWLENNIRTLLSTGNYTDDDPVIRSLRAQLHQMRR
jgi:hypothetical protein